jgi:hypothetical protein
MHHLPVLALPHPRALRPQALCPCCVSAESVPCLPCLPALPAHLPACLPACPACLPPLQVSDEECNVELVKCLTLAAV